MSKLDYINGIRGLCSLWVFFIHFFPYVHDDLRPPFLAYQKWNAMVPLFFLISGRVNNISTLVSQDSKKLISSMIRRPFRLLIPLQTIMLLDYFTFQSFKNNGVYSFAECFLQPLWLLFDGAWRPETISWAVWTLPIELKGNYLVYILTWIMLKLPRQGYRRCLFLLAFIGWYQLTHSWMTHFVAGLLLAELSLNGTLKKVQNSKCCLILQIVLLAVTFIITFKYSFLNISDPLDKFVRSHLFSKGRQGVPVVKDGETGWDESWNVFLFCTSFMFAVETSDYLQKFFSWKPFVFLGKISLSLYLIHVNWMYIFGFWFNALIKASDLPVLMAVIISASTTTVTLIIISYLINPIIDRPGAYVGTWVEKTFFEKSTSVSEYSSIPI